MKRKTGKNMIEAIKSIKMIKKCNPKKIHKMIEKMQKKMAWRYDGTLDGE